MNKLLKSNLKKNKLRRKKKRKLRKLIRNKKRKLRKLGRNSKRSHSRSKEEDCSVQIQIQTVVYFLPQIHHKSHHFLLNQSNKIKSHLAYSKNLNRQLKLSSNHQTNHPIPYLIRMFQHRRM